MEDEEPPELREIFIENFYQYLKISRDIMVDGPDCRDEYPFLGFTLRRTKSENNIWDILWEREDKHPLLKNSINVDHFESANDLVNELGDIAGVEFDKDEPDNFENKPDSPAFR